MKQSKAKQSKAKQSKAAPDRDLKWCSHLIFTPSLSSFLSSFFLPRNDFPFWCCLASISYIPLSRSDPVGTRTPPLYTVLCYSTTTTGRSSSDVISSLMYPTLSILPSFLPLSTWILTAAAAAPFLLPPLGATIKLLLLLLLLPPPSRMQPPTVHRTAAYKVMGGCLSLFFFHAESGGDWLPARSLALVHY